MNPETVTSPVSAQSGIHDGIRIDTDGPAAVIFNRAAGPVDLLSYAHGQLVVLNEVLAALARSPESTTLPDALQAILGTATTAIELAADQLARPTEATGTTAEVRSHG